MLRSCGSILATLGVGYLAATMFREAPLRDRQRVGYTVTRYLHMQWFTNNRLSVGWATLTAYDFEAGSLTNRSRVCS